MSSELPSASSRSVFSVFGFGSSHYSPDEDFSCPLETAPESFDASNSLTALTRRKKKVPFHEETVTISHEPAHKVQVNLPDQSELALQSFCQLNKNTSSATHLPGHHSAVRRYSTAQEEADDAHNSSTEVLTKFSNTLTQTAYMLTKATGSNTNIYKNVPGDNSNNSHLSTSSSTPYIPVLSRVKSSPHLALAPSFLGSPQKESLLGSEIISQYLRRHQSQNDLLEVTEYKMVTVGETPGKDGCDNTHPTLFSDTQMLPEEKSDAHSSGFSLLSRTRQFGAWLTKATEGEKVEVTKKDLNVLAPTSF